jgi:hypothetical protein
LKILLSDTSRSIGIRPEPYETVKWWQWILSLDKGNNPLNGANANQNLPFLCLACTGGGEDMGRKLQVHTRDAEKALLIPIFTSEYSTAELGPGASDQELLSQAKDDVKDPKHLELIIEDRSIPTVEQFYVEAGPFTIQLPPNHILDDDRIMAGKYRAMCAGYWMKLKRFQRRDNLIIQFGGTGRNGFHTKVRYTIEMPSQAVIIDPLRVM